VRVGMWCGFLYISPSALAVASCGRRRPRKYSTVPMTPVLLRACKCCPLELGDEFTCYNIYSFDRIIARYITVMGAKGSM
jgi:hypothetical protein